MLNRIAPASILLLLLAGCGRSGPPFPPDEALQTFKIEPGFSIELYASEPAIRSPVSMEFDENGRVFVVEAPGYPLNMQAKVGRIVLLEDEDDDGRAEQASVFADGLTMPTGIMRWKQGVLVTDAPDVLYFEDTNGDGRADIKRVALSGFALTNPQHTVNTPVYGLDNWIYLAHEGPTTAVIFPEQFGDRGGTLRFPDRPDAPQLEPARRMVRFRPDTGQLEYLSSSSQFGHSFDAWGHHFTVSNEDHIREEVVRAAYMTRNADLPVGSAMARISDHRPAADVYPIAPNTRVEMLSGVGSFTSACGITVYLGGAFPPSLGLFTLVAEPAHNLVHRDVLTHAGATHIARRAQQGVEFLASTDPWFRPVNFYIGPDGAIYVVDYYRMIIEHPEWMATDTHGSSDLSKGEDRGRIYRVSPERRLASPGRIRLGDAADDELVKFLASPNVWWRRTAQRLLVDRRSDNAVTALKNLLATSQSAVARLHALWTLDGLGKLETPLVERALDDPEAGVRENAIRLVEARLASNPRLVEKLIALERDGDERVQFQLLLTLGGIDTAASRAAQDRLLARRLDDPWMQIAALSASSDRAAALFRTAVRHADKQSPARATLFRQIAAVLGARRRPDELSQLLLALHQSSGPEASWWRAASLEGLAQGLGTSAAGRTLGQDLLLKLFESGDAAVRRAALRVLVATGLPSSARPSLVRAAAAAEDSTLDPVLRADAIGLVALGDPAAHQALFRKLIDPHQPEPVQIAAVGGFGRVPGTTVGTDLIERWKSMTPAVRMEAADAMFREPGRQRLLVEAIKAGTVQPWTLAFRHKRQLLMNRDASLREDARSLLEENAGERNAVLTRYQAALARTGDPDKGREVYKRVCANCHTLDGAGHEVGPDLGSIRNRPAQLILADIIMPSRSIAQNYESYAVQTRSRGMIDGVLSAQTPTTITIRHEGREDEVIRREDIRDMRITDLSMMPTDLDRQISVEQMADLLTFLRSNRQ